MDVIEKAIRSAFEKGDAEDRAFREKVYRSAFAALDRALQANPNVTVETAISRRKGLQAKITEIESEFIPAVPAMESAPETPEVEPSTPEVDPDPTASGASAIDPAGTMVEPPVPDIEPAAPFVESGTPPAGPASSAPPEAGAARPSGTPPRAEPVFGSPSSAPEPISIDRDMDGGTPDLSEIVAVERDSGAERVALPGDGPIEVSADPDAAVVRERRRPFAAMFLIVTLLAAGAIGLWWSVQTGLLKSPAERDTTVPNPPAVTESEDFSPDEEPVQPPMKPGDTDALQNWISVFSPSDPSLVRAPADTSADVLEGDDGQFLRIRSGTSGSAILFDVGQGILEQIAGKHAIFDIVAATEEGQETQISVDCNFGELGDCGRKRYAVGHDRGEFLFEMELPDETPGASGTIAINSDITNQGKAVDIYEIRVSVSE